MRNYFSIVSIDTHCTLIDTKRESASIDVDTPIDADFAFYYSIDYYKLAKQYIANLYRIYVLISAMLFDLKSASLLN